MLNELYALSQAISDMGIQPQIWHREYKQLPNVTAKAPCYKICVSETGAIKAIHKLQSETVQKIRKFGNNQASFPAFNIKPLYRIVDKHQKKEIEEIEKNQSTPQLSIIKSWLINDNWHKNMKNIDRAIKDMSNRMLIAIERSNNEELLVVTKLIQAVSIMPGGLRASLESYILSELEHGGDSQILLHLLFNSGNEDKAAEDDVGNNISVVFDLVQWDGYPVASERITGLINEALLIADETDVTVDEAKEYDAFGSPYVSGWTEPMPSVKLPGFDVTLRAMFHEQRCQKRYGEFDDASYPIAKENRIFTQ
jgi:hypothetical protein